MAQIQITQISINENKQSNMFGLIPELVIGIRNLATLFVCKDYVDAVYFSVDRFSLSARDINLDNINLNEVYGGWKEWYDGIAAAKQPIIE